VWQKIDGHRQSCHWFAPVPARTMLVMTPFLVLLIVAAIAALAPRYGADTRDGRDWRPRCCR
jgi:hypothetical protein